MSERLPAGPDERAGRAQAARTLGLVPSLDGVRGVAIIFICVYHLDPFIHTWTKEVPGLSVGVDIFFVLSGFLITAIMLREHDGTDRVRLTPFYEGRVLRLVPALFAMVLVEFLWSMLRHYPLDYEFKVVASALTYLSNWGFTPWHVTLLQEGRYPAGMGQLWSLAVEEQFYLLWPLLLIALLAVARRFTWAPITAVVIGIVAVTAHRIYSYEAMSAYQFHNLIGWNVFYQRTDYRVDGLLWGALVAMLWVRGWFPRRGLAIAGWLGCAVVVAAVLKVSIVDGWLYLWGMPVIAAGAAAVILTCVECDWPVRRLLETRWLCAIGVVSYGIYIWHLLAYTMVTQVGSRWRTGVQVAAALGLTAVMTLGSWYLVEKPFLRVKDRLRQRSSQSEGTHEAAQKGADRSPAGVDPEVVGLFEPSPSDE